MPRSCRLLSRLLLLALALSAGCASLPPPPPKVPSQALVDVDDTPLARIAAASVPADAQPLSGFRLMPEAPTAFNARVALMRAARKSLDLQYYLIASDTVGRMFLRELRDAAQRGVRVRLLVDDLYTGGEQRLLAGLAAHPNIELRIFNPFPVRAGSPTWRILGSLDDFSRINHRMHNKLFIADNSVAIAGGRNIADEYFMRSPDANFIDVDVLSAGPVVRAMSAAFDAFWNSPLSWPLAALAGSAGDARARAAFDARVQAAGPPFDERAHDVLGHTPLSQQLQAGRLELQAAPARVLADSPDKAAGGREPTVAQQVLALFASAQENVHIASPYFIPGEAGLRLLRAAGATQDNGRVVLVTNSIGATDEPLAYAAYAQQRMAMLQAGVRIYEIGADLGARMPRSGDFGASHSALHAKVATVDGRWLFIGSMNLDPRSALINTEIGLLIDSPPLARTMSALSSRSLVYDAYRLRLSADGRHVEWLEPRADGSTTVHAVEPGGHWGKRLQIWLLQPFVATSLL
ncbi:MAG: phospholipase D family protein [Proteobacteria bacterium]|nr:phospholipase D family protein [Pseudomonadota bacterium]